MKNTTIAFLFVLAVLSATYACAAFTFSMWDVRSWKSLEWVFFCNFGLLFFTVGGISIVFIGSINLIKKAKP